jgi:hypothetical protein
LNADSPKLTEDPNWPNDRRSRTRALVAVDLRLKSASLHLPLLSRTVDLSTASAFIRSARPLEVGMTVTVEFDRGRDRNPLAVEAEVVRVGTTAEGRPGGFAVRFLGIGPVEETVIDELIDGARQRSRPS